MAGVGFFWGLDGGLTTDEWLAPFGRLAKHLPGLGGVASYNALTLHEVGELLDQVADDLEREAAAWRKK